MSSVPYVATFFKLGALGAVTYAMWRVIEASPPTVPSYGRPVASTGKAGEPKFDEKRLMVDTLMGKGPDSLKELRHQTDERRRKIAEDYAKEQYELALKSQQSDKDIKMK